MADDGDSGGLAWWLRAAPALTFLIGLTMGGLVVGVAVNNSSPSGQSPPSTEQSTAPGTGTPNVTVTVPGACQDAAALVSKAVVLLRRGAGDIRDFQPTDLVEVLNELETTDSRLRGLSKECSAVGVQSGG